MIQAMKDEGRRTKDEGRKLAILGGQPAFAQAVPITKPTVPDIATLKEGFGKILESGMLTNSKFVQEFEAATAQYIGVNHTVAVNSCTNGMILTMRALGLTGEIIIPSFTFHATAHAASICNLKVIFVDCDLETYNVDPAEIEKAITPKTSAILAVHIFGNPSPVEQLQRIAKKYNLKLIFDAAHGFGSVYQGKNIGQFGDAEVFSLSPTKLLTTAEGGLVATSNSGLAAKLKVARNYGDSGNYDCEFSGISARMSEFHALLGLESLKMLEKNVTRRNSLVELYKKRLGALPGVSFQKITSGNRSSFKDFSILIDEKKFGLGRDALCQCLLAENIIVKKYFYPPVHEQKVFVKQFPVNGRDLEDTQKISYNSLSLPLFSHIAEETVTRICSAMETIYARRIELKAF